MPVSLEPQTRTVTSRIFAVLDAFRHADGPVTVSRLVQQTNLPRSTVHRMVADLIALGALERTSDGSVTPSIRMFELGCTVDRQRRLREVAVPFMEDLFLATGETVHLGLLDGTDVVYVNKVTGHHSISLPTRNGSRMPAHATGLGKAMLAFVATDGRSERPVASLTPRTLTTPTAIRTEMSRIRDHCIAFDREEAVIGINCVAAPIFLAESNEFAAISITGPVNRFSPDRIATRVRFAAGAISRALGGHMPAVQD